MARKRTKLEVTRDILEALKKARRMKITRLVYKSNLSNNSIKPYLKRLMQSGMVEVNDHGGHRIFTITLKGMEFLEEFNKIKIFSESYGI